MDAFHISKLQAEFEKHCNYIGSHIDLTIDPEVGSLICYLAPRTNEMWIIFKRGVSWAKGEMFNMQPREC